MGEVVLRLVDDSRISSFKPNFGSNLMTAFAQIYGARNHVYTQISSLTFFWAGHKVGIVANRIPVVNGDEASKGAQFIRLCNQS
jgi:acetyl-CoA carboxylase carboxyltransferase component